MSLKDWPSSGSKQKALYVSEDLDPELVTELAEKGWHVVDVRLMPNDSDGARADAWKAFFEGVRVGSIPPPDRARIKALELEGRSLGLLGTKGAPKEAKQMVRDKKDIDSLLNVMSEQAHRGEKT